MDDTQLDISASDDTIAVPDSGIAAELAWSAEEPAEVYEEPPWRDHVRWAALATLVLTLAAATVWLAAVFYREQWAAPILTQAEPTGVVAPTPKRDAPPVPLPTSGPPAMEETPPQLKAVPPQTVPPDADTQYLNAIMQIFGRPSPAPAVAVSTAHRMCAALRSGHSTPEEEVAATAAATPGVTSVAAVEVVNAAIAIYCPEEGR